MQHLSVTLWHMLKSTVSIFELMVWFIINLICQGNLTRTEPSSHTRCLSPILTTSHWRHNPYYHHFSETIETIRRSTTLKFHIVVVVVVVVFYWPLGSLTQKDTYWRVIVMNCKKKKKKTRAINCTYLNEVGNNTAYRWGHTAVSYHLRFCPYIIMYIV